MMDTNTELVDMGTLVFNGDLGEYFGDPVPRIVLGVDPGLNGDASDEAHCAFLLAQQSNNIGILAGQLVPSGITDNSLTPLVQMMRLATLIQQARTFVRQTAAKWSSVDAEVLVVVERNMVATAGPVYRQVLHLLRKGAWGGTAALGDTGNIIFVPDLTEVSSEELRRAQGGQQRAQVVDEDTTEEPEKAAKKKKVRRDPLQDRVGVYTTQGSKIRNSNQYLAQFSKKNEDLLQRRLVIINSRRTQFQLPGLRLMQTVEAQRGLFKLGEKQKVDGVVQHNDMYMVFTFTLAWVKNFQNYIPPQRAEFVRVAKYKENRALRLITAQLEAQANNPAEGEEEMGDEAPILQPLQPPTRPDNTDVLSLDAMSQEQQDAYVAITGVRFGVAYYLKRACSLLRRLILQRVLLEGWHESANCAVHWCRQAPRTSWKQVLLASNLVRNEEQARTDYGQACIAIHWRKTQGTGGLWWPTPPPAGSEGTNELRSLCTCIDSACQQARDVIARHHRHHPQHGATGRDLGVFCRLLQTCAQQLHSLSLTYDVECQGQTHTIQTEAKIRNNLRDKPPKEPKEPARIMDPDYAESYFSLLAYANAVVTSIPRSRAVLQKFAHTRASYPVKYRIADSDLELQIRMTKRVPYAAVCRAQLSPTTLADLVRADTQSKPQGVRCSIVAR